MIPKTATRHEAVIQVLQRVVHPRKHDIREEFPVEVAIIANQASERVRRGVSQLLVGRIDRRCIYYPGIVARLAQRIKAQREVGGLAVAACKRKAEAAAPGPVFQHAWM